MGPGIPTLGLADVHMKSFNMTLTAGDTEIAHFSTPVTRLALGTNKVNWDIGAAVDDKTSLLEDFIIPMFETNKTVILKLSSDDVSLVLDFLLVPTLSFHGLKLEKSLSCRMLAVEDSKDIPEK